jgi:hypothetical protein
MATWELTNKLAPFLDRHLVIPLMEFLTVKGIYDETDLLRCKLDLLANTNMVDYTMDVHSNLYPDQVRFNGTFSSSLTLRRNNPERLGLTVFQAVISYL